MMLWPLRSPSQVVGVPRILPVVVIFSQAKSPPGLNSTGKAVVPMPKVPLVEMW